MKRKKYTLLCLLMGLTLNFPGCVTIEPNEESSSNATEATGEGSGEAKGIPDETGIGAKETEVVDKDKKENKDGQTPEFSDKYLVGFDFGGSSWGEFYDCIDVRVIICTNRDVLVTAPSIETVHAAQKETKQLAKLTLTEEQYSNITGILDREKLYNMKIRSNDGVCDGDSYALILYDQDENVAKVCGAYMPTTKAFTKMYEGVMDNIPKEELCAVRNEYVDEARRFGQSVIVMDAPFKNCYLAYHDLLEKVYDEKFTVQEDEKFAANTSDWKTFGLKDVDGDHVDELIISNRELGQSENDDTLYWVVSWIKEKIYAVQVKPNQMRNVDFTEINYQDKDVMSIMLQAEGENCIDGYTKENRTFFYLITDLVWENSNYFDDTQENVDARKDYKIVSDLGERTDFSRTAEDGTQISYQYRMKEFDVRQFYEEVMIEPKDFKTGHDTSKGTGVFLNEDGYLYSNNEKNLDSYMTLDEVEKVADDLVLRATAWDVSNLKKLAYITVSLIEDDNKYGYKVVKTSVEKAE